MRRSSERHGTNPGTAQTRLGQLVDLTQRYLNLLSGLKLLPGQEITTTAHDYYATQESLRLASDRSGAQLREIQLYQNEATVTQDEIVTNIQNAIGARTSSQ